jgi:branched-chain amino acid transport system ATP-binding protein
MAIQGNRNDSKLEVEGIHLSFGGIQALSGVTLEMKGAEILGIIGPNGAGKSTLAKVLSGILKPQEGIILVNGKKEEPW